LAVGGEHYGKYPVDEMKIDEAIEYIKTFKYPRDCNAMELGCDHCPDAQMTACDKYCYAEDAISNEIKNLNELIKVIDEGIMKNGQKLKQNALDKIKELKSITSN
jgi:hypothetical protein